MEILMAVIHRQFCDWCGKEISPIRWLQGFRMFSVKKKYYVYEGYTGDIDRTCFVEDMICDDCRNELMDFVRSKMKRGDA